MQEDQLRKSRAHLIANVRSGRGNALALTDKAHESCAEFGYKLINYQIDSPEDFKKCSAQAVQAAVGTDDVILAAGGDGTIRGVVQEAHGKNVRVGVIACGTFNYFARTHQLPEDPFEALKVALTGSPCPVRLGKINSEIFLVNASLGLYAKAIRERAARTKKFGRHRAVAILSTMASLLGQHDPLQIELDRNGETRHVLTPMIFIGNNSLQLRDLEMDVAACFKKDLMALVMMKPIGKLETLRLLTRGVTKNLDSENRLETFCVDHFTIRTRQPTHQVALDGEIMTMTSPLKVETLPGSLILMKSS